VTDRSATEDGAAALREVEREWNAAARDWNAARLAALYTQDAVFYGGRAGHSVGREQIRAYFDSYAGLFASVRLALVEQELRPLGSGSLLAQGYAEFSFDFAAGGASTARLRSTLALIRQEEGWRILQHHFSATPDAPPIAMPER